MCGGGGGGVCYLGYLGTSTERDNIQEREDSVWREKGDVVK